MPCVTAKRPLLSARSVPYVARQATLRDRALLLFVVVSGIDHVMLVVWHGGIRARSSRCGRMICHSPSTTIRTGSRRRRRRENALSQQPDNGDLLRPCLVPLVSFCRRIPGLRKRVGCRRLAAADPDASAHANGGAGDGVGNWLHPVLQRPGESPERPLWHGMSILVLSTVVHFYSSSHLTAVTALKQLDNEFEAVSASLKVPFYKTFSRVTVPVCLPASSTSDDTIRQRDDDDLGGGFPLFARTPCRRRWRS